MKSQISCVDLYYLVKELLFLVGAKVDKIYHPKKDELIFQFHVAGKGKIMLRTTVGKFIFLTEYKEQFEEPSGFCMYLRKILSNARLRDFLQVGSERIVKLFFEAKNKKFYVYIELFGKGNLIVTDEKNIIINALEQKKWSDREIKKDMLYEYPKKRYNIFEIEKNEFLELITSDREISYILAKEIGVGGLYAEEICIRAGIDKKKTNLNQEEKNKIYNEFKKLLNKKIEANIIYKDNAIYEVLPFRFEIFKDLKSKEFNSFNEAFDFFYKENKEEFKSKHQSVIDKTNKIIIEQKKQLKLWSAELEEQKRIGELIYENYQTIEKVLTELKKAKERYSLEEIKNKLKSHPLIKEVDTKNKKITISIK